MSIIEKERRRRDWSPDLAKVLSEIKSFVYIYRDLKREVGNSHPEEWRFEVQVDEGDLESMAQVKCNTELFRASSRDLILCVIEVILSFKHIWNYILVTC